MKRSSIRDVAKAAGVSITTVSRALNGYSDVSEKTRERIREIAVELNYAPDSNARALGGMAEKTIALLVSDLQRKDESGFVFGMISGLYKACSELGCEFILLVTTAEKQGTQNFLQLLRRKNVDGVVVSGLRVDDIYYREALKGYLPSVLIDMNVTGKNICNVSIDNVDASRQAVKYLIDQGHRNIAMINGKCMANVSKQRFSGYAQALLDAGISIDLEYHSYCDFSEDIAYERAKEQLAEHPELTAFFCASDLMARGVLRAIEECGGRVPEDFSVIGFDDIPLAPYIGGGLTTVGQDPYEMGYDAGLRVHSLMEGQEVDHDVKVPFQFRIRNTAGPVRK